MFYFKKEIYKNSDKVMIYLSYALLTTFNYNYVKRIT